jgi:hypothetical protein
MVELADMQAERLGLCDDENANKCARMYGPAGLQLMQLFQC